MTDATTVPAADPAIMLEMTGALVAAYVSNNHVQPSEMSGLIAALHAALASLGRAPEPETATGRLMPRVPIKKTVTDEHIISLEDGKSYKALKRHLGKFGLTPRDYREKWGLPSDYPMVAPAYARQRSALAKQNGLGNWRRTATEG